MKKKQKPQYISKKKFLFLRWYSIVQMTFWALGGFYGFLIRRMDLIFLIFAITVLAGIYLWLQKCPRCGFRLEKRLKPTGFQRDSYSIMPLKCDRCGYAGEDDKNKLS